MGIAENIRQLRTERGLSQQQLADAIGVSRGAIYQYEKGNVAPRMGTVEKLARVFGVTKSRIIESSYNYEVVSIADGISDDEGRILAAFRKLPLKAQKAFLASIEAYIEQ